MSVVARRTCPRRRSAGILKIDATGLLPPLQLTPRGEPARGRDTDTPALRYRQMRAGIKRLLRSLPARGRSSALKTITVSDRAPPEPRPIRVLATRNRCRSRSRTSLEHRHSASDPSPLAASLPIIAYGASGCGAYLRLQCGRSQLENRAAQRAQAGARNQVAGNARRRPRGGGGGYA